MAALLHQALSQVIIGCSMDVLNELRPGLDEKLYENALVHELKARDLLIEQQRQFPVVYKEQKIGVLIPDLIVNQSVIVDTKVVSTFNDSHTAQMIGYLTHTSLHLGLLMNFKYSKLKWQRVVN